VRALLKERRLGLELGFWESGVMDMIHVAWTGCKCLDLV